MTRTMIGHGGRATVPAPAGDTGNAAPAAASHGVATGRLLL
jgi:hypothetical protein